jgi:hypothetical protein
MAEAPPQFDDPSKLAEKIGEALITGSLYRKFIYTGESCHFTKPHPAVGAPRYGQLPRLRMFCDHPECSALTWWEVDHSEVYFKGAAIQERLYTCRNCGRNTQHYHIIWYENRKGHNTFIKTGQWPPLAIEPSPELAKALGPDDSALYKKGLVDFNFGHGIGAVGYFRRVLENKINALLDLIVEAARNAKVPDEQIAKVAATKTSHRVEDKIDVAVKILPAHLKPGGHNPLDKLYKPLSAGLHGESDDECLTVFSEARFVFEYLFKNLAESNEEARRYVKELSAPPKAAGAKELPPQAVK